MFVLHAVVHALNASFLMLWEILWPLALGFTLSAIVQTVVSRRAVSSALGGDSLRSLAIACGLGAASSSCSYAAVAIARSLFRKGASFTSAIVFEFASTNLVFELGLLLLILLGWQFVAAEFVGGLVMIAILVVIFRRTLTPSMVAEARRNADRGVPG
ncbi:MAG: permease, partial [Bacillati bacterium ANGP1]